MEPQKVPTPSILKKTPSVKKVSTPVSKSPVGMGSPSGKGLGVHFAAPSNLGEILKRASDKDKIDQKANIELEGIITHIRNQRGPALIDLLQQIQQNVAILKPRMEKFVVELLRIGWVDQDSTVVAAFREFLVNLVTAQIYFTKPVVKMLVTNLRGVENRSKLIEANEEAIDPIPLPDFDAVERTVFENTHQTLEVILRVTPLAGKEALSKYTKECLPYALTLDTPSHSNYLTNLLRMMSYVGSPADRLYLLTLVIERLVQIDAHVDKDLLEEEEEAATSGDGAASSTSCLSANKKRLLLHTTAKTNLDKGMQVLVSYIDNIQSDDALKEFYFDFVKVFEAHVLPVPTGHVQFIAFYLMGRYKPGPALTTHFLEFLWKKFQSPNTPSVIRQSTMSYIASLTSRALFVSVPVLFSCLEKISGWIHGYIDNSGGSGPSLPSHGPFYSACQALFYMFVFRHEELTVSKKHLAFLRTLHLNSIVTCRLNPLYYCLYQVVANFSAISRNYQLAYCETVIQRNNRISLPSVDNPQAALSASKAEAIATTNNHLDSFFPFDPYRLPGSRDHFQRFYREYRGATFDEDSSSSGGSSSSESGDEGDSSDEDNEDETKEGSASPQLKQHLTHQNNSSDHAKRKNDNSEIDDYLMELDDPMETPKQSRGKRRGTDSMLSSGSIGPIDFGYGTSPGFKH